jgi:hypothetical protein
MKRKSPSCITVPWDTSALRLECDSESLFADNVSSLNLGSGEKRSFDPAFQTLLPEANQELTALLREVHPLVQQRQVKTLVECVIPIIDKHLLGGTR